MASTLVGSILPRRELHFLDLITDVQLAVFCFLGRKDLFKLSLTCRAVSTLVRDPRFYSMWLRAQFPSHFFPRHFPVPQAKHPFPKVCAQPIDFLHLDKRTNQGALFLLDPRVGFHPVTKRSQHVDRFTIRPDGTTLLCRLLDEAGEPFYALIDRKTGETQLILSDDEDDEEVYHEVDGEEMSGSSLQITARNILIDQSVMTNCVEDGQKRQEHFSGHISLAPGIRGMILERHSNSLTLYGGRRIETRACFGTIHCCAWLNLSRILYCWTSYNNPTAASVNRHLCRLTMFDTSLYMDLRRCVEVESPILTTSKAIDGQLFVCLSEDWSLAVWSIKQWSVLTSRKLENCMSFPDTVVTLPDNTIPIVDKMGNLTIYDLGLTALRRFDCTVFPVAIHRIDVDPQSADRLLIQDVNGCVWDFRFCRIPTPSIPPERIQMATYECEELAKMLIDQKLQALSRALLEPPSKSLKNPLISHPLTLETIQAILKSYTLYRETIHFLCRTIILPHLSRTLPNRAVYGELRNQRVRFEQKLEEIASYLRGRFETEEIVSVIQQHLNALVLTFNNALTKLLLERGKIHLLNHELFASFLELPSAISVNAIRRRVASVLVEVSMLDGYHLTRDLDFVEQYLKLFGIKDPFYVICRSFDVLCIESASLKKKTWHIERIALLLPSEMSVWLAPMHAILQKKIQAWSAYLGEHLLTTRRVNWLEGGQELADRFDAALEQVNERLGTAFPPITREWDTAQDAAIAQAVANP